MTGWHPHTDVSPLHEGWFRSGDEAAVLVSTVLDGGWTLHNCLLSFLAPYSYWWWA